MMPVQSRESGCVTRDSDPRSQTAGAGQEANPPTGDRVHIIFIGGFGRSGSTLVDRLLGSQPEMVSLGELTFLWDRGVGQNQLCGCGLPFADCDFWERVMEGYAGVPSAPSPVEMEQLRRHLERPWFLPALLSPRLARKPFTLARERYAAGLRTLHDAVSRASGARYLIDSSKEPRHGLLLSLVPDVDLHVIHLIRDSRAVAFSWSRPKVRPEIYWTSARLSRYGYARSAVEWNVRNWVTTLLERRVSTYHLVRYEDVIADPEDALGHVTAKIGIREPFKLKRNEDGSVDLGSSHTLAGNPMRFQTGAVRLAADDRWLHSMHKRERWLVSLLTFCGLVRHGYIRGWRFGDHDMASEGR